MRVITSPLCPGVCAQMPEDPIGANERLWLAVSKERDRYREALEKIKALGPRRSRLDAIEIATEATKGR